MIISYKHKSTVLQPLLVVETVVDKLGNIFYSVQYQDNDNKVCYVRFKNMSSVIDFVSSNIK